MDHETREKNKNMFKIKTIPKCPKRILQSYQADEDLGIDVTKRFEVKTKEKSFTTSIFPFLQTDFLVDQLIGKPEIHFTSPFRFQIEARQCQVDINRGPVKARKQK